MKRKSAPHLQIDHTLFSAYLPVPKHVTQGSLFHDRMTVMEIYPHALAEPHEQVETKAAAGIGCLAMNTSPELRPRVLRRAGGVAEFPNVTALFVCDRTNGTRRVVIELATAPEEAAVVKRFQESFTGDLVWFVN